MLAQIEADKAARRAEKESAKAGAAAQAVPAAAPVAAAQPAVINDRDRHDRARTQPVIESMKAFHMIVGPV